MKNDCFLLTHTGPGTRTGTLLEAATKLLREGKVMASLLHGKYTAVLSVELAILVQV